MGNNLTLLIRQATATDTSQLFDLLYRTWLATYPNARYGVTEDDIKTRFLSRNGRPKQRILAELARQDHGVTKLLAFSEECFVGACIVERGSYSNEIQALYVYPVFQRRGVGYSLWNAGMQYLDSGRSTIVRVATYNYVALAFYDRMGFRRTDSDTSSCGVRFKNGVTIPELTLIRYARCGTRRQ